MVTAAHENTLPRPQVPNLHVVKLMQSLVSRGYVKEKFSWQWFYYSLTNEVPTPQSALGIVLGPGRGMMGKERGVGWFSVAAAPAPKGPSLPVAVPPHAPESAFARLF